MKISCILVEDEPLAQERIKGYLQKLPFLELLASFESSLDALGYLRAHPVDLVFLDINLGEFSGIQLLETTQLTAQVIITTAYDNYALKGFDLQVADYLLKPFTFDRFVQAVDKATSQLQRSNSNSAMDAIFVKTEFRLEKVPLADILYIEGMRDYRRIFTRGKRIMTLQTFRQFEQEIPPIRLCRVHKSYMVSIDKIDAIEKDMIRIGHVEIPISETYKKAFYQLIGGHRK